MLRDQGELTATKLGEQDATGFPVPFPKSGVQTQCSVQRPSRGDSHETDVFGSVDFQLAKSDLAEIGSCNFDRPHLTSRPFTAETTISPLDALKS